MVHFFKKTGDGGSYLPNGKLLRLLIAKDIETYKFAWQLGRYEPSSSYAKELHGGSYLPNGKLLCLCHNNRDNTGMAIIKFVKQLNKYKPSSSSAKELYELSKTSRLRITHGIQTHIL